MRPYVVSHLNAKATRLAPGGICLFQGKSRNVHWIGRLPIKCNSFAESPNLVQQTGQYSPSLLIACSVTLMVIEAIAAKYAGSGRSQPHLVRRGK